MRQSARRLSCEVLVPGRAEGLALALEEPLSFWGGFDPHSGEIVDVHHPQRGQRVGGRVLFLPGSRGSAGTPGGIAETLRAGSGPAAFVVAERDVNIGVGVLVANRLYDLAVPVLALPADALGEIHSRDRVLIGENGLLEIYPYFR